MATYERRISRKKPWATPWARTKKKKKPGQRQIEKEHQLPSPASIHDQHENNKTTLIVGGIVLGLTV